MISEEIIKKKKCDDYLFVRTLCSPGTNHKCDVSTLIFVKIKYNKYRLINTQIEPFLLNNQSLF